MTPLTYTDPATARRYVDAVTSLSELGRARFGRPLVLANYTDVGSILTSLDGVDGVVDETAFAGSAASVFHAAMVGGADAWSHAICCAGRRTSSTRRRFRFGVVSEAAAFRGP